MTGFKSTRCSKQKENATETKENFGKGRAPPSYAKVNVVDVV